jgi:beta-N-acetylhexosaminidase
MTDQIGCFIVDLEGKEVSPEDREILAHPLIGGIILFSRNYDSRTQLKELCEQIRKASSSPLLIMVDQEGGRVQRFIHEFTRIPAMGIFGELYDNNPASALHLAKDCAWLMATELLALGLDLSLAPVLDLNKGKNSVIANRAFHNHSAVVIPLAQAFMQGMREAGMGAVGKHFPGHGTVTLDSHVALPRDERELKEIEADDMATFKAMVQAGISAIMPAHIVFSRVDTLPVGFSSVWLKTILRKQLGFTGTIISDDLNMAGANISNHYEDRVIAAREAGCDFTLLCNNRRGVIEVLDNLTYENHQVDKEKWSVLQGKFSSMKPYHETKRWQDTQEFLLTTTQKI